MIRNLMWGFAIASAVLIAPLAFSKPSAAFESVVKQQVDFSNLGHELLLDPGFETGAGWKPQGKGFERESSLVHSGRYAIVCHNSSSNSERGATEVIQLNQTVATPIVATAWSRCKAVSGSPDTGYSLYLDIIYQDGTPLWGQVAEFDTSTHGWQRRRVIVWPIKPIKTVYLYALFRNHIGTAWFDDVTLHQLTPENGITFFDTVPVSTHPLHLKPAPYHPITLGGNLFQLKLNLNNGEPTGYAYRNQKVTVTPSEAGGSGFFVRDAAAKSNFYGCDAPLVRYTSESYHQSCLIAPIHLRLEASYTGYPDHVSISGRITDTSGKIRAVTLYYALPASPKNLIWWDTLRSSRPIQPTGIYADTVYAGVGTSGLISRIPFACLQSPRIGLAIALPMNRPRVARIVYDAPSKQYYVAFDFGMVPNGPPSTFHFVIFAGDPKWGLRAVERRYMKIYPSFFVKRVHREGIWMPFTAISSVQKPQDFGFGFHEGNNDMAWDNAHHVYCFRYTEPMSWWMPIPKGVKRTYQSCMTCLDQYANGTLGNKNDQTYARAVQSSDDFTGDGHYFMATEDAPWAPHSALFINNCNPKLPERPGYLNRAHVAWSKEIAHQLYGKPKNSYQDGEYLDSLEMGSLMKNYRTSQFPYESESLTFDTNDKHPCILEAVSTYEFVRWISKSVHRLGKLMFANDTPVNFYWYAGQLDVMGIEINWLDNGKYQPESDSTLLYRRMIAGQKPYLLMMDTNFDQFDHDMIRKYMQRSLFYAMYPSMFSYNAANNPYWENPNLYNRDRGLFEHYIPIIRALSQAGWEPVTKAWTGDPKVWVERYGGSSGKPVSFTVFNNSPGTRDVQLNISASLFRHGLPSSFTDRIDGRRITLVNKGKILTASFRLGSQEVAALFPEQ
ncbi:MAG: hypothetical protein M1330_04900 [Armatimonadetes bacterium]|nr:hypothetical protein [Armatimonadota bacterium]